jgi:3'-phosphoadenosine 5'-phosphosulfate sulfotransferase (PAPS reductase)/FAD synthetase
MTTAATTAKAMSEYRKKAPKPEPDWFWLLSGGIDSVAAFLLTKDALSKNFQKRPVAIYLDTRIGLPLQRLYVEQVCDRYNVQLWTLRTHEKFERRVSGAGKFDGRDDAGAPGGAQHRNVQNELKGRQRDKIADLCDDKPVFISGSNKRESAERAAKPKIEERRKMWYYKPVYGLSKTDCARIILRHEDCPINPAWSYNHATDCFCLANGDPSELDNVEQRFPEFGERLREIEESAVGDGVRSMLGWDGLSANEKSAKEAGHDQMSLCSEGCSRAQPTPIVDAFEARATGATVDESLAILGS